MPTLLDRSLHLCLWPLLLCSAASLHAATPAGRAPDAALETRIEQIAQQHHGKVAFYAENLKTRDRVTLQPDTPVQTASIIKLALLWEAMQQVRAGRAHWSDKLTLTHDNQTDGSGVLGFFDTPLTLTLKDVLSMMVIVSDNTATNLAIDTVGLDATNKELQRIGLKQTWLYKKIGKPSTAPMPADQSRFGLGKTTAHEISTLMQRIVTCRLSDDGAAPSANDRAVCDVALGMLRNQMYRDGAPRYLEAVDTSETGSAIASKTGALDAVRNDVDAIATKNGLVILTVLTWDNADKSWTDDTEAYLTSAKIAKNIIDTWSPQGLDPHGFDAAMR